MAITLTKNSISLEKGAPPVSLIKEDATSLTAFSVGLGWDPASGGASIDLDASAILLQGSQVRDLAWYSHLTALGVIHQGDNLTGDGDGDDEVINVDLSSLPIGCDRVVITINSYSGQRFSQVKNAYCRLFDGTQEYLRYNLSEAGDFTGVFMAEIFNAGGVWQIKALGVFENGRTVKDMTARAQNLNAAQA